jgi:SWI/SNF-related matrix-associated actin-dependent regulator 1 of chromatin subfamily A
LALTHCEDLLENLEKLLVFAYHKDVLDGLRKGLKDYGVAYVDGDVLAEKRADEVQRFQESAACRVFVGQVQAAGVGLTLTAASHGVFVEREWNPSKIEQAEDRMHRVGQTEPVLWQHLVIDGSVDALMTRLIMKKLEIVEGVMNS